MAYTSMLAQPFLAVRLALAVLCVAGPALAQQVIYVKQSAPSGGDGRSWATAYTTLDSALADASREPITSRNALIFVARGVYVAGGVPSADTSQVFEPLSHTHIYGGCAGDESSIAERDLWANPTVLSADGLLDNGQSGVPNSNDRATVLRLNGVTDFTLDGFTVASARSFGTTASTGAAIRITGGGDRVILRNCLFTANIGGVGGALYIASTGSPTIESCRFVGNTVRGRGGAAFIASGRPAFVSCLFSGNSATGLSGGSCPSCGLGGALSIADPAGSPQLVNCTFFGNSASVAGGAVYSLSNASIGSSVVFGNLPAGSAVRAEGELLFSFTTYQPDVVGNPIVSFFSDNADPGFVDADGADNLAGTIDDDLRLGPASPCINAGESSQVIGLENLADAGGAARRQGPEIDRGAFETGGRAYSPIAYVREGAIGLNDGSSWENAFSGPNGLANALAANEVIVSDSDVFLYRQIWVAQGTYRATDVQGLEVSIPIYGGFAGTERRLSDRQIGTSPSVVTGDVLGDDVGLLNRADNARHVIRVVSSRAMTLDGLTIRGGEAVSGFDISSGSGGGLLLQQGPLFFVNRCTFEDNNAVNGGGLAIVTGNLVMTDCHFARNRASSSGGAMNIALDATLTLDDSSFVENTAGLNGGACAISATSTLRRVTFVRNSAGSAGGGLFGGSSTRVSNALFAGNRAQRGGGASGLNSGVNLLFVGNTALLQGGAAAVASATSLASTFVNCTFAYNTCENGPSGGLSPSSVIPLPSFTVNVRSSNLWGNAGLVNGQIVRNQQTQIDPGLGTFSTRECQIEGWTGFSGPPAPIATNGLDPLFVRTPSPGLDGAWGTSDDDYGDLRLAPGSPAIDSGISSPGSLPPRDVLDLDADGDVNEITPVDLANSPRLLDDPATPNLGVEPVSALDRGCYEFQPGCPSCVGVREWVSPTSGLFASAYNWTISVPDASHDTLYGVPGTYTVDFPGPAGSTITNRSAAVRSGAVTFALGGDTLRLTRSDQTALVVGDTPGATPSLTISNGTLRAPSVQIGQLSGSAGVLNVSGSAARVIAAEESLSVGFLGTGTMNITGGGQVTSRFAYVGDQPGGLGTVLIDGPGSRWTVPFSLTINNGRVTVRNGGVLATSFGLFLGQDAALDGDGTINGPVINFGSINPGNSPGTLTINGDFAQVGEVLDLGSASGSTTIQVNGTTPGTFDRVVINGRATLGGGLIVEAPPAGFPAIPEAGLSLPIIDVLGGFPTAAIERFDVAYFPRLQGAGGGPSDKFLKLVQPEGGGGRFFNLTTGGLGQPINVNDPSNTTATGTPSSAVAGDLDSDGLADLVLTVPSDDSVVILMNRGSINDEWQGFQGAVQFAVGDNPQGSSIFDIDQDGKPDLTVANAGSNSVSLFRNNTIGNSHVVALAGQGTLATGATPMGVDVNRFDGSGTRPVIITTDEADGSLSILVRTSTPGFMFGPRTLKPVPTATPPRQPRCLDIDGDGARPDLALLSASGNAVLILQNISVGTGIVAFADAEVMPVGEGPVQLEVAALRDGRPSLVTANSADGTISVLINTADAANPARFAPAVNIPGGSAPLSVASLDIDADDDADLALLTDTGVGANPVRVRILRNDYLVGNTRENDQVTLVPDRDLQDDDAPTAPLFVVAARLVSPTVNDLITINAEGGGRGPGGGALNIRPRLNATMGGGVNTCFIDFNNDGIVSPDDLGDYITVYFSDAPENAAAEFNGDGVLSPDDLDDYITAYFEGC